MRRLSSNSVSIDPKAEALLRSPRKSLSRWSHPIALAIAAVGGLWLAYVILSLEGRSLGWGLDYLAYHDAALRLAATGTPYQAETIGGPFYPGPSGLYLYSPPPAALVWPIAMLGAELAIVVWLALHVIALVLACALMPVSATVKLAAFGISSLSWPVLFDIKLGNVSIFVTLLAVASWRWLDRPGSAFAIALSLFVRPTMAVVAVSWALRRHWRGVVWTAVAAIAVVAAFAPFIPLRAWTDYAAVLRNGGDLGRALESSHFTAGLVALGLPDSVARFGLPVSVLVGVAAVVLSLRRDAELGLAVAVSASLLLSPLLWDHYLVQLLLPAAFLASRGRVWGLGLPLLGWLPTALLPLVAISAVWLPFLARSVTGTRADPVARPASDLDASVQTA